jgi:hypothetical protein
MRNLIPQNIFVKDLQIGNVLVLSPGAGPIEQIFYYRVYPSSNPDSLNPDLIGQPVLSVSGVVMGITRNDSVTGTDGSFAAFDVTTGIYDNGVERPGDTPGLTNYLAFEIVQAITGNVFDILTLGLDA